MRRRPPCSAGRRRRLVICDLKKPGVRTSTASAPSSAARFVARDRRLRRLAAGADDERPAARHQRRARRRSRDRSRRRPCSAASPFDPSTTKPVSGPSSQRANAAFSRAQIEPIVVVERRRERREHAGQVHGYIVIAVDALKVRLHRPVVVPAVSACRVTCSTRFRPEHDEEHRRRRAEQPRESRRTRGCSTRPAASCPSSRTGSGNPRPTYDSVASATMNAGTSSVDLHGDEAARGRQQMPRERRGRGRRRATRPPPRSRARAPTARSRARRGR